MSVEEIVAQREAGMKLGGRWGLGVEAADALIVDWRKRGEAAEAMRAKTLAECEAIARDNAKFWGTHTNRGIPCIRIADEIAALKDPKTLSAKKQKADDDDQHDANDADTA